MIELTIHIKLDEDQLQILENLIMQEVNRNLIMQEVNRAVTKKPREKTKVP